jgi:Protein of unknown function (DUF2628)
MAVYTVHQPPLKKNETAPDPERFAFVRDGFSFWAFLLGPLWMLWHRMWLVLIGYVVVAVAIQVGLWRIGVSAGGISIANFLLAVLVGLEAGTLRRFTLGRRRWRSLGTVVGSDRETIEQRFFDGWVRGGAAMAPIGAPAAALAVAAPHNPATPPEVIGLFPQPGAHR